MGKARRQPDIERPASGEISKLKIALGAASLFLFLIGIKRTFRTEEGTEVRGDGEPLARADQRGPVNRLLRRLQRQGAEE